MIYIISGTNRPNARSRQIANIVKTLFDEAKVESEIMCLRELGLNELDGSQYGDNKTEKLVEANNKLLAAKGFFVICPEYNGSYPGILKYFIDHWAFPDTFEFRPVSLVGLGGLFGGLRPVEHLQQVFGYRNSFIYPERTFLTNIWGILKDGKITDDTIMGLLRSQVNGFSRFVTAIHDAGLDANTFLANKPKKS